MKRLRNALFALGLAAVVSGVSGAATVAHASISGPLVTYVSLEIMNFGSGQCLQPVGESTAAGAAIVQEPCNGRLAQTWYQDPPGGTIGHYWNANSGLCLDTRGGAANGTPVQQWACNSISNENWEYPEVPSDSVPPLISRVSGTRTYCLDVPGAQHTPGLAMQIYRCNGSEAQLWWQWPPAPSFNPERGLA